VDELERQARTAGVLYLLVAITAPIGLIYAPGALFVSGNAPATAHHIRTSESILRIGIASELFHQVVQVFLVLALYRLFKAVNEAHARQLVIFGALVSVPIVFVNVINEIAALILASGAEFLSVFDKSQLDALAYLFVRLHSQGINVVEIFWGLWLFPFGILVRRSGFIPRALGVLLMLAGCAYVVDSLTTLLLPRYADMVGELAGFVELGEIPIIFWLLIWGAKERRADTLASP
jgi:hypothetical protein